MPTERKSSKTNRPGCRKPASLMFLVALLTMSCCGCVQRRMVIRSQPEGAFVTIDNQPIGYAPLKVPFTYYGTREIQLEKDGYKTVKVREQIKAPWYEKFPASFVADNFAGKEIRDERVMDFQLEPRTQVQENLLLDRANNMRGDIQRGTLTGPIQ